jgi:PAS domain S-box-containing protein
VNRFGIDTHGLVAQIVLSSAALVLFTAVAVGLPAIWLIRDQLDRQAWAQVDQASRAVRALYAARRSEVTSLATLTGQRPTLREFLDSGERAELSAYLRTLQIGAGLDLLVVCDLERQAVAQAGEVISQDLCEAGQLDGYHVFPGGTASQVWILSSHPISDEAHRLGDVVAGLALDDEFAGQMRAQSGLEHTLLIDEQPVATSFTDGVTRRTAASRRLAHPTAADGASRETFTLDGRPYYSARVALGEHDLEAEVALDVADIAATQRSLVWTMAGSILAAGAVSSVLGTFLARRISGPLARLADTAAALSKGEGSTELAEVLAKEVSVEAQVREVALVARALEGARADLQHTLAELRREKAWTDHLLEAVVEGIVTVDTEYRITFFSKGAERITGWDRDQVAGRPCDEVFRTAETDEPFSHFIPPPGRKEKITVALPDARRVTLAVTGARLTPPGAGDAEVALVFRDVTEEEAMHRLLGHFLANVTHEFRTPLSAVAASAELLLDQFPDLSDAELHELLTSLRIGILGLQTLVDNLLESASIEAGHFRVYPRACDLGEIIAEAALTMRSLLDKHGQRLVVDLPAAIPVVHADPRRTVQVLVNLLSNASKYGPDDDDISVGATVTGEWVRVAVADRGPGVDPSHRAELFQRFIQPGLGNDTARYGAGLGLSVVKAIVESLGGHVGFEDRSGGGSVFWFTLPVGD